ncbi:MAG: UDP-N-acetylmuramate dehydrogenase [Myxococcales bacterium]|nr:UDP-N-acetylmuramate dehydrogenase [Myxococcales bacterium]MDH3483525.1 UDP-N-acetylmuramate dehydrogenase [Myxococcales bacterium]
MTDLEIQRDVPLAPLTTLELGGPARFFARVADTETLLAALRWAREEGHEAVVLGGGSNLIVPDEGYPGLVIHMAIGDIDFKDGGRVEVGAGVPWEVVVDGAVTRGWAGLECLTGIPGSTGATPIQNVGAYGQEVSEVIARVLVVDRESLALGDLAPEACEFGYRDSMFKREPGHYVVFGVHFALRTDGAGTVRYAELEKNVPRSASLGEIRSKVLDLRRRKSMVVDPDDPNRRSAGSFFLNPVVTSAEADRVAALAVAEGLAPNIASVPRYPTASGEVKLAAGWLIEKSGIAKGTRRGAVGLSSKHALALIHHGGGTTTELLSFADEVRARVKDRFGISLQREPRLLT